MRYWVFFYFIYIFPVWFFYSRKDHSLDHHKGWWKKFATDMLCSSPMANASLGVHIKHLSSLTAKFSPAPGDLSGKSFSFPPFNVVLYGLPRINFNYFRFISCDPIWPTTLIYFYFHLIILKFLVRPRDFWPPLAIIILPFFDVLYPFQGLSYRPKANRLPMPTALLRHGRLFLVFFPPSPENP